MKVNSYRELIVWQKSIKLIELTYELIKSLPKTEEYGLSSQMKRAAVTIASNIAEGFGRKNTKEYIQFLYISISSAFELETQLVVCQKVFKISNNNCNSLLLEIIKMLYSLIGKLKKKSSP